MKAPIVVTPGDPQGIGPEVVGKALKHFHEPVVVVGSAEALQRWLPDAVSVDRIVAVPGRVAVFDPGDEAEPVEVRALRAGVRACRQGHARALVTGPIHKARLAHRGFVHPGHTEFLAELCGTTDPVMAFVGGQVRVALVTVHLPLAAVPGALTTDKVLHTIRCMDKALREVLGLATPRLAVCGLNPHAGDSGVLGTEDLAVVAPGVRAAVAEGIDAVGPVSAENAFRSAVRNEVDAVIATYHDQGLAPLKALEWARVGDGSAAVERAVNWTLNLPILRVGVDHGTADDIAGKGIADEGSLLASLRFADRHGVAVAAGR